LIAYSAYGSRRADIAIEIFDQLFIDASEALDQISFSHPTLAHIKTNSYKRACGIKLSKASHYYDLWRKSDFKNAEYLNICTQLIGAIRGYFIQEKEPRYLILSAIVLVLSQQDYQAALKDLLKINKRFRSSNVQMSMAFVYAAIGNFEKAANCYKAAAGLPCQVETIYEVELFLEMFRENYHEDFIDYVYGLMNYYVKGDLVVAKEYFLEASKTASDKNNVIIQKLIAKCPKDG
jgi:tetratricopeptide (TPR) repeat protein